MLDTGLKTVVDLYEEPCLPLADLKPTPGLQNFIKTEPNCDLYATRSCLHQFCNCTLYSLSFPRGNLDSPSPVRGGGTHAAPFSDGLAVVQHTQTTAGAYMTCTNN